MEWGVEVMADDPVSTSQQASAKKNTTYIEPRRNSNILLLSQHGSKLLKNNVAVGPMLPVTENTYGENMLSPLPDMFITFLTFLLPMCYIASGQQ